MSAFAPTLKAMREGRGLSQSKLAKRAEVSHSYVSRLESGERNPTREAVDRLAAALRLDDEERDDLMLAAGFASGTAPVAMGEVLAILDRAMAEVRARIGRA